MRGKRVAALTIGAAALVAACSSGGSSGTIAASGPPNLVTIITTPTQRPVVDSLASTFKQENPGLQVAAKNDGPGIRAAVANGGAQVVIAPKATLGGRMDETMGRNLAVIAVPTANPGGVKNLEAFSAQSPLRTRICGLPTIYGDFMLYVFTRAGVAPNLTNLNRDPACAVLSLADLAAGRLDAAVFFRNNTTVSPSVKLLGIPDDRNLVFDYGAAFLGDAPATTKFREFLASDRAKEILTQSGYLP